MTFAGAEAKRRQTKWRCPTGECKPASRWIKTDRRYPLIPRPKVALYADLLMLARLA